MCAVDIDEELYWRPSMNFPVIDFIRPGEVTLIGSQPSLGKTALVSNIVQTMAIELKQCSLVFSTVIATEQLLMRYVSALGSIDYSELLYGELSMHDFALSCELYKFLSKQPILFDDTPVLSLGKIIERTCELQKCYQLKVVVIDQLQFVRTEERGHEFKDEVTSIMLELKKMASNFDMSVIVTTRLYPFTHNRVNMRPVLSDLVEVSHDWSMVDVFLFIYRDDVYNPDAAEPGFSEFIIARDPQFPERTYGEVFQGKFQRFIEPDMTIPDFLEH